MKRGIMMRSLLNTWRHRRSARNDASSRATTRDEGSVMILALVYLTAVSISVLALAGWSSTSVRTTVAYSSVRQLQSAARSTTELAMQNIRYSPQLNSTQNASPPVACWGNNASSGLTSIDGYSMNVWCSTVWSPTSGSTRVVTFSTCQSTVSAAACATSPYLQAVVTYDDYPPGGAAAVDGPCTDWNWCGQGMTVDSWIWA
jgi:hypothetical protein